MLQALRTVFKALLFIPKSLFKKEENQKSLFFRNFLVFFIFGFFLFYYGSLYYFYPYDNSWITVLSPEDSQVLNAFGKKGAFLSSFSLYYLGLGSWFLPVPFFIFLLVFIESKVNLLFILKFLTSFLTFMGSSLVFISYFVEVYIYKEIDFLGGGVLGRYLFEYLSSQLGLYGAGLLSGVSLWFSFILLFDFNFFSPKIPKAFFSTLKFVVLVIKKIILQFKSIFKKSPKILEAKKLPLIKKKEEKKQKDSLSSGVSHLNQKNDKESFYKSLRELFKKSEHKVSSDSKQEVEIGELILKTFEEFGIKGTMLDYVKGPSLVTYHFRPEEGVRQAKVFSLANDLALALKVQCIMIKPATEQRALGIQVPRQDPELVSLGDILQTKIYAETLNPLTLALGLSEKGEPVYENLGSMPHLLIAGSTGSGKSVCLNTFICSILAKASPDEVRFLMIDPKMLELSVYNSIPHLLAPVVTTDLEKAKSCLNWAVYEMERRYSLMEKKGVRDLASYNEKIHLQNKEDSEKINDEEQRTLPSIVLIIDELADLMLMAAKDIEGLIQRLTQKARACGIHLILATQRPSVDVVTGIIKANLPCRISFRVVSRYDSKTILDQNDAENLLGRGDMLFMKPGVHNLQRIQGAFVSENEVSKLVEKLKNQGQPFDESVIDWIESDVKREAIATEFAPKMSSEPFDVLYEKAIEIAKNEGLVSTSFLQRHLGLGYNRAAKIIEKMESESLISHAEGSKKRKWLGK